MTRIKDVLQIDPTSEPLVNQGQARLSDDDEERAVKELRGELKTFVCKGQYAAGIHTIIESFLADLGHTSQKAAWVSGFFGSGKSHLLKMLANLWQDTAFDDGTTARAMVRDMPDDLRALFKELDTAGRRAGGLFAAAGTLPSGSAEAVRLSVLRILFKAAGLPGEYRQASFCLWLQGMGVLDTVKAHVAAAGKDFGHELNRLHLSRPMAEALVAADVGFSTVDDAKQSVRAEFADQKGDISTDVFLDRFREVLKMVGRDGRMPCTLLVLDEVQQYIGDSESTSTNVTEVAEAICKNLDSHVMLVGAGQSALTSVPLMHKMMDRFVIKVPLSDVEIETVTREVLLAKKPSEHQTLKDSLDRHAATISRQLQGTRIAERPEDREALPLDYPILPVRRRFWEECFRQIDTTGTHSQLRSQLRIIHDALGDIADKPLGTVIRGDVLYDALAPLMIQVGSLNRETDEQIQAVRRDMGERAARVCGLIFLISWLRRSGIADLGVRATRDHIADLLIDDLSQDSAKLREEVGKTLKELLDAGKIIPVGNEVRLQTREGAEWDRDFRARQANVRNDDATIHQIRDKLLYEEVTRLMSGVRFLHGQAKVERRFALHRDAAAPARPERELVLWVRDGWGVAKGAMETSAREGCGEGVDSPVVYVHLPRREHTELKNAIVDAEAAKRVLDARGTPTLNEGQEAWRSMDTRLKSAQDEMARLVQKIVADATVWNGGGTEVFALSIEDKLRSAGETALDRQFPQFRHGDAAASAWDQALRTALQGGDQPLSAVGWGDTVDRHPVAQELRSRIGAGKIGSDLLRALTGAPYGWPKEAVETCLVAMHRSGHVSATLNNMPLPADGLDRGKIGKAHFKWESRTLTVRDRLALRGLFVKVGLKSTDESLVADAATFLARVQDLGSGAGGPPPLPEPPTRELNEIADLARQPAGNEQLYAIREQAEELGARIEAWKAAKDIAERRRTAWALVERLATHSHGMPEAAATLTQVEAVRSQRLLLQEPDLVAPLRQSLGEVLRTAVGTAFTRLDDAVTAALAALEAAPTWAALPEEKRRAILRDVQLDRPVRPSLPDEAAIADLLDRRSLASFAEAADAVPARQRKALEMAAKELEPKLRTLHLPAATLRSPDDLQAWLDRTRAVVEEALAEGPVLVG